MLVTTVLLVDCYLRSPVSDPHSCISLLFLSVRPVPGARRQPSFLMWGTCLPGMTEAPGAGEGEGLLAEVLPFCASVAPLVPVKAFLLREKLGQPAFGSWGWSPCKRLLSGYSLDCRPGLRMVWNAGQQDHIGVTRSRGSRVGWLRAILTPPLPSCVTSSQLFTLSEPMFPHL